MFDNKNTRHRYSALLLLVLVVYAVVAVVLFVLDKREQARNDLLQTQFQLEKYTALVASLPSHLKENKAMLAWLKNDERYLVAKNHSMAVANFQNKVSQLIYKTGAELISMQVEKIKKVDQLDIVPVKMKLRLRLDDLTLNQLLHQLEGRTPYGFIYNIRINHKKASRFKDKETAHAVMLDVYLEYTTYMDNSNVS